MNEMRCKYCRTVTKEAQYSESNEIWCIVDFKLSKHVFLREKRRVKGESEKAGEGKRDYQRERQTESRSQKCTTIN